MKKSLVIVSILLIVILSFSLVGCSLTKSVKVIPEGREVESMELIVFNAKAESIRFDLTNEEVNKLSTMFDNLGYLERQYIANPIQNERIEYTLVVNIAKKNIFKKAYTYYIYIGVATNSIYDNMPIINSPESSFLRVETDSAKYSGKVNEEVLSYLGLLKAAAI
ncbi:MAG: hypothetical protein K5923_04140 [Clostridia bacterium]|nr:hypothetical protein [Clostridia bacterium]